MNKKVKIALFSILAILIVTLATTYAFWYVTRYQTNENVIASKCLNISLTNEENDIELLEAYPITDEEGMKLTPYTFTVTNNCDASIDYQINLESLGDAENSVSASSIKVSLNEKNASILSNKYKNNTTIEEAYEAYIIGYGRLEAKESDNHKLKLWVDEAAPVSESNKTYKSKIIITAGQEIKNSFEEGTLAFDIVGNAGGFATELSAKWQDDEPQELIDWSLSKSSSYYWATDYNFDSDKGLYSLAGNIVYATVTECRTSKDLCGEYSLIYNSEMNDTSQRIYKINTFDSEKEDIIQNGKTFTYVKLQAKTIYNEYTKSIKLEDPNLYRAEDNYGTSYYFRGNVKNNYVKFGKYEETGKVAGEGNGTYFKEYNSLEECKAASSYNKNCAYLYEKNDDMYWRIVRVNGDGTIRVIYDGTKAIENGVKHLDHIGGTPYNESKEYLGYTYENEDGIQTNSTIKSVIDKWYDTNLKTNYGIYIADRIFCQDKGISETSGNTTYYKAVDRINVNKAPQLKCVQKEDRYTMNTKTGNGLLTNPVGLITADEIAMSGGVASGRGLTFLYSSRPYWSITPYGFYNKGQDQWGYVFYGNEIGTISYTYPISGDGATAEGFLRDVARPVINLKADVEFAGDGTIDNPYQIITN